MPNSVIKSIVVAALLFAGGAPLSAEPVTSYRYQWRSIEAGALKAYFRELIRVTDTANQVHTGMLTDVFGDVVRLLPSSQDNTAVIQLRLTRIKKLEVFERLATNEPAIASPPEQTRLNKAATGDENRVAGQQ